MNPFSGKTAAEIAVYLAEKCGFSMVPLRRGTKVSQLSEWAPYQTQAADTDQILKWTEKFPGCNWGCVAGAVSDLVVFDCDDEAAYRWAQLHLPTTPVKVKTSRGWHLYYHHPGPEYVEDLRAIDPRKDGVHAELRRDGQYAVSPGSLHENGVTIYTADVEFPGVWEYAPEFAILKPASSIDLSGLDERIADIRAKYSEVLEGNRHNTLLSYAAALIGSGCPPDRALKLTLEKNNDICTPPLKAREVVGIVGGIYKTHQRNHPLAGKDTPDALATDMSGLELQPVDREDTDPFPPCLLQPGGLLEEVMDYIRASSIRTRAEFSFGGAVSLLATLLGQRIRTATGLTTNVYLAILGRSASGKDAPKRAISRLLGITTGGDAYGGIDIASDAAIVSLLAQEGRHRMCFLFDELGLFLKACKTPNSPRAGVAKVLTQLFSCYDTPYVKAYADTEKTRIIPWQALNVLGFSVPGEFWGAIQAGELTNGFLSRFIIIENDAEPEPRNYHVNQAVPDALRDKLSALWAIPGGEDTPDVTTSGGVKLERMVKPRVIPFTEEAENFIREKEAAFDRLAYAADEAEEEGSCASSVWGRCGEHVRKLSLVFSASRLGAEGLLSEDACVTLDDMRKADALAEWSARRLIRGAAENAFSSDFEEWCLAAQKAIKKYRQHEATLHRDKPGAPWYVIEKALKGATPKQAKDVRDKLIQMNRLRVMPAWRSSPKSKKTLDLFCLVEEKEVKDE